MVAGAITPDRVEFTCRCRVVYATGLYSGGPASPPETASRITPLQRPGSAGRCFLGLGLGSASPTSGGARFGGPCSCVIGSCRPPSKRLAKLPHIPSGSVRPQLLWGRDGPVRNPAPDGRGRDAVQRLDYGLPDVGTIGKDVEMMERGRYCVIFGFACKHGVRLCEMTRHIFRCFVLRLTAPSPP